MKLRLAGVEPTSLVDGTGLRYTVFTQGCNHHCRCCHNPESWSFTGGYFKEVSNLCDDILQNPYIQGVTISGGEPFEQVDAVTELITMLRTRNPALSIWVYTGFTFEDLISLKNVKSESNRKLLDLVDVLVDGEYKQELRTLDGGFRGSTNQRFIDVATSLLSDAVVLSNV